MATPRKKPADKIKTGRPTDYKPEYCNALISHMKGGGSMESFGSVIGHSTSSIYLWLNMHPEFSEAQNMGKAYLHAFYENLGKTITAGQLRRIKSERPMLDAKGNPMLDPNTGQVMYEREYESATPGQTTFVWMTKNILKWRDRHDIELSGKDGGPITMGNMSEVDMKAELARVQSEMAKILGKK